GVRHVEIALHAQWRSEHLVNPQALHLGSVLGFDVHVTTGASPPASTVPPVPPVPAEPPLPDVPPAPPVVPPVPPLPPVLPPVPPVPPVVPPSLSVTVTEHPAAAAATIIADANQVAI